MLWTLLGYVRNMWTCLRHVVDMLGPYCGHGRIMFGTCFGQLRPILRICLRHVVDMLGPYYGHGRIMFGTC